MLTLKRVMICLAIFGTLAFAVVLFSGYRRREVSKLCIQNLQNYNTALNLYRADSDGNAPFYTLQELRKNRVSKLASYTNATKIACPWADPSFEGIGRIAAGSKAGRIMVPFGIEDNSAIFSCSFHLDHKQKLAFNGLALPLSPIGSPVGGVYHVLLRNGTVKPIPFNTPTEHWISNNGLFKRLEDRPKTWTGYGHSTIFDFEPKPPQFEY